MPSKNNMTPSDKMFRRFYVLDVPLNGFVAADKPENLND
jgi:hypothetical protein